MLMTSERYVINFYQWISYAFFTGFMRMNPKNKTFRLLLFMKISTHQIYNIMVIET